MTHDEVQREAMRWLLHRSWCGAAAPEVGFVGGRLDVVGASGWPGEFAFHATERADEARRAREEGRRMRRGRGSWEPARVKSHEVGVIECKARRGDLLDDLRQGKMLRYTALGSRAWLAVAPAVFGRVPREGRLDHLVELGLPADWGVLIVGEGHAWSLRPARKLRDVSEDEAAGWRARIARALSWRAVR